VLLKAKFALPGKLRPLDRIAEAEASVVRTFTMETMGMGMMGGGLTINGKKMDSNPDR